MKIQTPEQINAEIKRRNALFKGKTNAEKRVLIAQDVINQIKTKKLYPSIGTWVNFYEDVDGDKSFREAVLSNEIESCECCALGGVFLSCTLFNNKIKVEDMFCDYSDSLGHVIEDKTKIKNGLNTIFSIPQLKLIEQAFETGEGFFYADIDNRAVKFGRRYKNAKTRLIGIMKNIIKNNGTFIP